MAVKHNFFSPVVVLVQAFKGVGNIYKLVSVLLLMTRFLVHAMADLVSIWNLHSMHHKRSITLNLEICQVIACSSATYAVL